MNKEDEYFESLSDAQSATYSWAVENNKPITTAVEFANNEYKKNQKITKSQLKNYLGHYLNHIDRTEKKWINIKKEEEKKQQAWSIEGFKQVGIINSVGIASAVTISVNQNIQSTYLIIGCILCFGVGIISCLFSFLTRTAAHNEIKRQISTALTIVEHSTNWDELQESWNRDFTTSRRWEKASLSFAVIALIAACMGGGLLMASILDIKPHNKNQYLTQTASPLKPITGTLEDIKNEIFPIPTGQYP